MIVAYGNKNRIFNTAEYLTNRAARILPLYFAAMFLMLLYYFIRVNVFKTPSNYYVNTGDTLLNTLLLQSWLPGKALTLNPPAWSLSVEAFFYISFPFIFTRIYTKLSLPLYIRLAVIFFIISQVLFHVLIYTWPQHIYYFYFQPILRLNEFLIGNALGALFLMRTKPIRYSVYGVIALMILSVVVLRIDTSPVDFHNGLFALFFGPMLYLLATSQGTVNRLFSKKLPVYLGEISYGVYIFQYPVYFFFTATLTWLGTKITPPLFYIYMLILLIVSVIFHELIELPLRKRIRKMKPAIQTTTSQ